MIATQWCPTLATPWIEALQAPLPMGFSRQEHRSGLPLPSPGADEEVPTNNEQHCSAFHSRLYVGLPWWLS